MAAGCSCRVIRCVRRAKAGGVEYSRRMLYWYQALIQRKRWAKRTGHPGVPVFTIHDAGMKIDSIIIERDPTATSYLRKCLLSRFPEIAVQGEARNFSDASRLIENLHPALVFLDATITEDPVPPFFHGGASKFETVYISHRSEDAIQAIRWDACGFLLKPLTLNDIVVAVGSAIRRLSERYSVRTARQGFAHDSNALPHTKLIGIPAMEGIEFLYTHEIIRCVGLQKCTQVISTGKTNIVSSYNIGEFRKLLEEYGFFLCHKSHLINLMYIKRLTREGFIYLIDNSAVPLARRKRPEFLQVLKHL